MGYLLAAKPEEAEAAFHQALEGVSDDDFAAEVHHLARLAHEADRSGKAVGVERGGVRVLLTAVKRELDSL